MFIDRSSKLLLSYTVANWPDADVDYELFLNLPGIGDPRAVYHTLKGSAPDMTWPQGTGSFPFPDAPWYGNQLLTDAYGHDYGIRSWSITALPGAVPGRLTVASYKSTNTDDAAPDDITDYDLGTGGWDSGALPVHATDGTVLWREPRLRWVPINLLSLL
ncbi:MAG: hypothetical protein ACYC67_24475 [Prosthecobacter sp.]